MFQSFLFFLYFFQADFPSSYCSIQAKFISFCFSWGNSISRWSHFLMSPVTASLKYISFRLKGHCFYSSKRVWEKHYRCIGGTKNSPERGTNSRTGFVLLWSESGMYVRLSANSWFYQGVRLVNRSGSTKYCIGIEYCWNIFFFFLPFVYASLDPDCAVPFASLSKFIYIG